MEKSMIREAEIKRTTKETDISCKLLLDGSGKAEIDTGVGFFDHMLTGFAKHGFFDLSLKCRGDLEVDCHHTIEDCGIVLGQAVNKALGDKAGIVRFGSFILPMDEALVLTAIDLSGRPCFSFDLNFRGEKCGEMDTAMCREFFYAVSTNAMMNLHIRELSGLNDHHLMEAAFKSFGKALSQAVAKDDRIEGVLSTKGSL